MKSLLIGSIALVAAAQAIGADAGAGRAKVEAVCSACHGVNGISVSDTIPNLAGQRAAYLGVQLRALKDGTRKNAVMNAIAGQLSADDIANVAAYFASQTAAAAGAKSEMLPTLVKTGVKFPEGYQTRFTKYHTIDFPATRQVRHYYANDVALKAAREGRNLPNGTELFVEVYSAKLDDRKEPAKGSDGRFVTDQLLFFTAMARDAGWGNDIPEMLRNEDWNYAVFSTAKAHRAQNQAECLACHKPLDKVSYTFTLEQLAKAAKAK